jgi:hypothetical protein
MLARGAWGFNGAVESAALESRSGWSRSRSRSVAVAVAV